MSHSYSKKNVTFFHGSLCNYVTTAKMSHTMKYSTAAYNCTYEHYTAVDKQSLTDAETTVTESSTYPPTHRRVPPTDC